MSFEEILKKDQLTFDADPGVEQRLMYHYQLKAGSSQEKSNSIFPFADNIFSVKFIGLKIGLVSLFALFLIGYHQFNTPKEIEVNTDTASISHQHDTLCSLIATDSISIN